MTAPQPTGRPAPTTPQPTGPLPPTGPAIRRVLAPSTVKSLAVHDYRRYQTETDPFDLNKERTQADIARYKATFRLLLDDRGSSYIDSRGRWFPIPAHATHVHRLDIDYTTENLRYNTRSQSSLLLFSDDTGRPLLRLPSYGWDGVDLDHFAEAAGWDLGPDLIRLTTRADLDRFRSFGPIRTATVSGREADIEARIAARRARRVARRARSDRWLHRR